MKLTIIFMIALISILLIVGCGSPTDLGQAMDNDATVIERTDVYSNVSMAAKIGNLDAGESVKVTHRWGVKNLCLLESSELTGWVKCNTLEIEE